METFVCNLLTIPEVEVQSENMIIMRQDSCNITFFLVSEFIPSNKILRVWNGFIHVFFQRIKTLTLGSKDLIDLRQIH